MQDIRNQLKIIHGNSKISQNAQHAYDIIEIETGRRVKTGVSGGKIRKDKRSYRAVRQTNSANKKAGYEKYTDDITNFEPAGIDARQNILEYERERAKFLREVGELDEEFHKRP